MGLSYSYELIAGRESSGGLVRALCDHLHADDRSRMLAALNLGAAEVMVAVKRDLYELRGVELRGGSRRLAPVCLSFLFTADGPLTEYSRNESGILPDGRVRVACVHTSIEFGSRFVLVQASAATSDMSRLFKASASVRETFCAAGRAGNALLVSFDDEEDYAAVWPRHGRLGASNDVDDFLDDEANVLVDPYCAARLASAKLEHGGPVDAGA